MLGTLFTRVPIVKRFILSALFLAIAAIAVVAADASAPRKAPELAFNIPGEGQRLLSQYRGKVVALEFILTTCPHCQAASKTMTQFEREYAARGFQALDLAINGLDEGRSPADADQLVQKFAKDFQVGFPVGWVPRDQMMAFMGFSMMVRMVVPQLALIDRKGNIRYQTPAGDDAEWSNLMNDATIRQHIEELLSEGASSGSHGAGKSRIPAKKT
jgi:thiol-disulfide isomerase/thioredoxin